MLGNGFMCPCAKHISRYNMYNTYTYAELYAQNYEYVPTCTIHNTYAELYTHIITHMYLHHLFIANVLLPFQKSSCILHAGDPSRGHHE